jgi:hypothetical protein
MAPSNSDRPTSEVKVYSDVDAARMLPTVLERAKSDGFVRIRTADGTTFDLTPTASSPLAVVPPVESDATVSEIVEWVRESRERH